VDPGPFVSGKAEGVHGDSYFAVIEFSTPVKAEALLGYGNWSRVGSKHVEDQLPLMSNKQMRPVWRTRAEIEAHLESRKLFSETALPLAKDNTRRSARAKMPAGTSAP